MSIRISTSQTFNQGTAAILENQSQVATTQLQLSKGTRILKPSDDPLGSSIIINMNKQIASAKQFMANGEMVEARLAAQESSLASVSDILGRVRDLTLQGASDTLTYQDRQAIAVEMKQRLSELVGLGNTQMSSGEYLFSGFKSNVQPFTRNGTGSMDYNGDQGVQLVNVNTTVRVENGNSGDEVFMNIANGNGSFVTGGNNNNMGTGVIGNAVLTDPTAYIADTYTVSFADDGAGNLVYQITGAATGNVYPAPGIPYDEDGKVTFNGITYSISGTPAVGDTFTVEPSYKQDVFATVQQIIDALDMSTSSDALQATFHNALNVGLQNLDQAITHMDQMRASVGSRLNVIDSEHDINDSLVVETTSALSLIKDLDYAEAITELNKRSLALQAAQQSFVKIQGLNLFEFI